jgi:hypothetical protein
LRKDVERETSFGSDIGGVFILGACGSTAGLQSAQSNKSVQRTEEVQAERQVIKCLPTAGGVPDPLLLRRSSERARFASCTGVAKRGKAFDACAFRVLLGGLPTTARLQKGLVACVEKNA